MYLKHIDSSLSKEQAFRRPWPLLNELEAKHFVEDDSAIIGFGGIGKTQIAKGKRPSCSIFWVTAISIETFEQAYLEIGGLLQIPGVTTRSQTLRHLSKIA